MKPEETDADDKEEQQRVSRGFIPDSTMTEGSRRIRNETRGDRCGYLYKQGGCMAKFRYRMQNILTIKEKLETQAKNEYAAALMRVAEEEEELQRLRDRDAFLEEEGRRLVQADSLSIRDIEDNKLSIDLNKEAITAQIGAIERAREFAEEKREAMVELMQERKTHDILKERAFQEFLQEEKAEESKQIDQLTSYTYGQRKAESQS